MNLFDAAFDLFDGDGTFDLGSVYTERQYKRRDNSATILVISFSLNTMESLENVLQPDSGATPLFSIWTVSVALSQSCA